MATACGHGLHLPRELVGKGGSQPGRATGVRALRSALGGCSAASTQAHPIATARVLLWNRAGDAGGGRSAAGGVGSAAGPVRCASRRATAAVPAQKPWILLIRARGKMVRIAKPERDLPFSSPCHFLRLCGSHHRRCCRYPRSSHPAGQAPSWHQEPGRTRLDQRPVQGPRPCAAHRAGPLTEDQSC